MKIEAAPNDARAQVELGLQLATQRPVETSEIDKGVKFVESLVRDEKLEHPAALRYYCLLLLNLNEFVYLD